MKIIINDSKREELKTELAEIEKYFGYASDSLLVIGGDGTLNYYLNNEHSSGDNVIYLPYGTANDFARNFDLIFETKMLRPEILQEVIDSQYKVEVPVMTCNDQKFINAVSFGFPANITESGDNALKRLMGQWSYYLSAVESLFSGKFYECQFKGHVFDGLGGVVGQGLYAGGGVKAAPQFNPAFGDSFYLTLSTNPDVGKNLKSVAKLQSDRLSDEDALKYFSCEEQIKVTFNEDVLAKIDGEEYSSRSFDFRKTKEYLNFYIY